MSIIEDKAWALAWWGERRQRAARDAIEDTTFPNYSIR